MVDVTRALDATRRILSSGDNNPVPALARLEALALEINEARVESMLTFIASELARSRDARNEVDAIAQAFFAEPPLVSEPLPESTVEPMRRSRDARGVVFGAPAPVRPGAPAKTLAPGGSDGTSTHEAGPIPNPKGLRQVSEIERAARVLQQAVLLRTSLREPVTSATDLLEATARRTRAGSEKVALNIAVRHLRTAIRGAGAREIETSDDRLAQQAMARDLSQGTHHFSDTMRLSREYDELRASGHTLRMSRERFIEVGLERQS
ncbi:MAG TPA: hypothetical protein PKD61_11970 [Polyangiaceae bacterium]|nr:hypothetical protein [Polyangiaceae bacterium]